MDTKKGFTLYNMLTISNIKKYDVLQFSFDHRVHFNRFK